MASCSGLLRSYPAGAYVKFKCGVTEEMRSVWGYSWNKEIKMVAIEA
jgi:hypothetical protein